MSWLLEILLMQPWWINYAQADAIVASKQKVTMTTRSMTRVHLSTNYWTYLPAKPLVNTTFVSTMCQLTVYGDLPLREDFESWRRSGEEGTAETVQSQLALLIPAKALQTWLSKLGCAHLVSKQRFLTVPTMVAPTYQKFIPRQITSGRYQAKLYGEGKNIHDWIHTNDHSSRCLDDSD